MRIHTVLGRPRGALLAASVAALALAGCATPNSGQYRGDGGYYRGDGGYQTSHRCRRCGVVDSIRPVYTDGNDDAVVLGTVIGAAVGALVGHQIGDGDGRTAATVGGAVAGGAIGRAIGRNNGSDRNAWRVRVHLDDGRYATVTQDHRPRVRVGDYVEIRNDRVYAR